MPGNALLEEKHDRRRRTLTSFLKEEARDKGFDVCRVTLPDSIPQAPERLADFLAEGYHGTMDWMADTADRRADPRVLWNDVRSVVLFGMNYGPDEDPRYILDKPELGAISVYARNRDYHDVIKGKLKEVATRFAARAGEDVKVFVDTAPVMEKPLAEQAGLGWRANIPISSAANSDPGYFSAACSPRLTFRSIRRSGITAAPAAPVSMPVRPTHFRPPTGSTRAVAFPI